MRFSIYGAEGFIGRNLRAALDAEGHDVYAPSRRDSLRNENYGHVIYAIGLTADFRTRPFDTIEAHVTIVSELLRAMRFESFLLLSSTRVYGKSANSAETADVAVNSSDPSDLYNLSKLAGEAICFSVNRPEVRIARLSNVVGPNEASAQTFLGALCREARQGHITLESAANSQKDYIWIDDAVSMLTKIAVGGKARIYNVASGRQLTHRTWVEAIARYTGCSYSMLEAAADVGFAPIATERIVKEFGFEGSDAISYVPQIVGVV